MRSTSTRNMCRHTSILVRCIKNEAIWIRLKFSFSGRSTSILSQPLRFITWLRYGTFKAAGTKH